MDYYDNEDAVYNDNNLNAVNHIGNEGLIDILDEVAEIFEE